MKKLLSGRIAIVVVAVIATVAFFSFKSGDDRNFQIAKNLDIFNAICLLYTSDAADEL